MSPLQVKSLAHEDRVDRRGGGEWNVVHRVEFELLARVVGEAQHVHRQSEWAVQVSHKKSDVARAALKADVDRFSRHSGKSTLDAIISEFRLDANYAKQSDDTHTGAKLMSISLRINWVGISLSYLSIAARASALMAGMR